MTAMLVTGDAAVASPAVASPAVATPTVASSCVAGSGAVTGSAAVTVAAALRWSASATLIDRRQPMPVFRQAPTHRIEVARPEGAADRTHLAGAHLAVVHLNDRADLDARP